MNRNLKIALGILILFFFGVAIFLNNFIAEENCKYYKDHYKVILNKKPLFDKCLFVENEKEYTKREYYNLHRYDGMEVRS